MKTSQLRQLIREEIQNILEGENEEHVVYFINPETGEKKELFRSNSIQKANTFAFNFWNRHKDGGDDLKISIESEVTNLSLPQRPKKKESEMRSWPPAGNITI